MRDVRPLVREEAGHSGDDPRAIRAGDQQAVSLTEARLLDGGVPRREGGAAHTPRRSMTALRNFRVRSCSGAEKSLLGGPSSTITPPSNMRTRFATSAAKAI